MVDKNKRVSAFCNDVMADFDGVALSELINSGELSAKEVTQAAIQRTKAVNPALNALAEQSFDVALATISASSKKPTTTGFANIPTFVKDNEMVAGLPTRHGSAATSSEVASHNSRFVDEYLATGLVSLGKTRLPEFGLTACTDSVTYGATVNPWHSDYSCGASSGGSAALVAAGAVPFAHANDGGGSIRIPAACCGLVGLKPSRGRLAAMAGTESLPINIVQQGIVSRSVRDTCAFYTAAERVYRNNALPAMGTIEHAGKKRLRIGLVSQHVDGGAIDAEILKTVEATAKLCESLGHQVEPVSYPVAESAGDDFLLFWAMQGFFIRHFGASAFGKPFDKNRLEPLTNGLSKTFMKQFYKLPFAISRLKKLAQQFDVFYQDYDILLSPIQAQTTTKIGYLGAALDYELTLSRLRAYVPFTAAQNVTGAPAISLPMGQTEKGLPVGIQFAADFGQDRHLLELALELEQASQWHMLSQQKAAPSQLSAENIAAD